MICRSRGVQAAVAEEDSLAFCVLLLLLPPPLLLLTRRSTQSAPAECFLFCSPRVQARAEAAERDASQRLQ
jgi:hypothetical protein